MSVAAVVNSVTPSNKPNNSKVLKTKKKVKSSATKEKPIQNGVENLKPDESATRDSLSVLDETNDTKNSQTDEFQKKRDLKETAKIAEVQADSKHVKKVKKLKSKVTKTDENQTLPPAEGTQPAVKKKKKKGKKAKSEVKTEAKTEDKAETKTDGKVEIEAKTDGKEEKTGVSKKKKKIKKKGKGTNKESKEESKKEDAKEQETKKEEIKKEESKGEQTTIKSSSPNKKDNVEEKKENISKIEVNKIKNVEETKVKVENNLIKEQPKSLEKDKKVEESGKINTQVVNSVKPQSPPKEDKKFESKSPIKNEVKTTESPQKSIELKKTNETPIIQNTKSPVKSPTKVEEVKQKSPLKGTKVSPAKKSKSKIDPKLYAPKKVPFAALFCKFVLPYYDYIDTWCRIMSLWNHSMSKLWKRNEQKFIEQKLLTKRMLQLTDEFLEIRKLDVSNINYSFYILDIVQINLKDNFEKFIQALIKAMDFNMNIEYRKKDIEIIRLWWYRLTVQQENSVLKFLRKKVPEHKLFEIYDNKDKLDFIITESSCNYFRKPQFSSGSRMAMVTLSKSEDKEIVSQYSNWRLDYRFMFEWQDKEDHLKKSEWMIRCLSLKGFQKEKWESLLEWNKLKVSMLKIGPNFNNLDWFIKLTPNMQSTIKYFSIGYNFRDKPLNTKQGMKAAEGLALTLEKLPSLESLVVWGYPITTTVEALSKTKTKLQSVKIIWGAVRNFMFDEKVGELHCNKGIYEYRNGSLLYRLTVRDAFYLYDEAWSPIQKERWKSFNEYIEVRSFSIIQLLGDVTVTSYNDIPVNSLTKTGTSTPWIVIMKPHILRAFMDHKKVLSSQIQFLREVTKDTNRLSCDINNEGKFEFMKSYMHKFNWHDLTVSVELTKQKDRVYLIQTLAKQKHLKYLRLVIRSPQFLNEIISKLYKINVSDSFEIIIIDLMFEEIQIESKPSEENQKDAEMSEDTKDQTADNNPAQEKCNSQQSESSNTKGQETNDKEEKKKLENLQENKMDQDIKNDQKEGEKKDVEMKDVDQKDADQKDKDQNDDEYKDDEHKDDDRKEKNVDIEIKELNKETETRKLVNWFDEWKASYPDMFKFLRWRARLIIEKDPKLPTLQKKYKIKSYWEEDC